MTTDSSKALPKTFNDAGLYPPIVAVLKSMKISVPTKIQAEILGPARAGLDIIAISATGSGKTIAYLLPLFEMLKRDEKTRGLILTPTRETADQILKVLEPFADELGLSLSLVIGGRSAAKQENELKSRARIVVATPGRLNDHLLNNKLLLQETRFVVVDEADRMLDMGFAPQLQFIQKTMRGKWQTILCSASSLEQIQKVSHVFAQSEPVVVTSGSVETPVEKLNQTVVRLERKDKSRRLMSDIESCKGSVLVFAASQERCDLVHRFLSKAGVNVDLLHGGLRQGHRNRVMRDFRAKVIKVLIATDVLARGLDVDHVDLVINIDLPYHAEDFLHRIGRTARAGRSGRAITYLTPDDHKKLPDIERYLEGATFEG